MLVQQISVYVENRPGRLAAFTQVMADCKVDMKAISIADTSDFGILRCIVDKPDVAVEALKDNGFAASITEVLALGITNQPGGLDKAADLLNEANISIEYIYSFMTTIKGSAVIIFRVDNTEKALEVLENGGITVFRMEEIVE